MNGYRTIDLLCSSRSSRNMTMYKSQSTRIVSGTMKSLIVHTINIHVLATKIILIDRGTEYNIHKGNNKLTNSEQSNKGKVKTHKYINRQISQQPENCENRNDPDLVQAFLKKWWVESDFKAPNLPLSLRLKVSGCHYNSIYNNT